MKTLRYALCLAALVAPAEAVTFDAIKGLALACDGVTNDAPALQTAVASYARQYGSVTVTFGDGVVCAIGGLTIGDGGAGRISSYNNVNLVGAGPGGAWITEDGIDTGNTRFVYPPSSPLGGYMIRYAGTISGSGIQGIRLDGQSRAGHLIWATNLYEGTFRDLVLYTSTDYAVLYDGFTPGQPATMRTLLSHAQIWTGAGGIKIGDIATDSESCSNKFYDVEIESGGVGPWHSLLLELGDSNQFFGTNIGPLNGVGVAQIAVQSGVAALTTTLPLGLTGPDNIFIWGSSSTYLRGNFDVTPTGPLTMTFQTASPDGIWGAQTVNTSGLWLRRAWQNLWFGLVTSSGFAWTEPTLAQIGPSAQYYDPSLSSGNELLGLMDQEMGGSSDFYVHPGRLSVVDSNGNCWNMQAGFTLGGIGTTPTPPPVPTPTPTPTPASSGVQLLGPTSAPRGVWVTVTVQLTAPTSSAEVISLVVGHVINGVIFPANSTSASFPVLMPSAPGPVTISVTVGGLSVSLTVVVQ